MPRALEVLDATLRRIEQGEIDGIEALDQLLIEELTVRESRRIKTALTLGRLTTVKTLAGFDFAFQPSLDRQRILAWPNSPSSTAPRSSISSVRPAPARAISPRRSRLRPSKPARSVYFATLADIVTSLATAEREGQLRQRLRYLCRASLLVVDEIGYLPVVPGGGNLFFQLVNARYEKGAMILTSNRGFAEWGEVFGDPVVATALLDRLLHHAVVIQIEGSSYPLRQHADLVPEHVRSKAHITRRRRQNAAADRQQRNPTITTTADHRSGTTGSACLFMPSAWREAGSYGPQRRMARSRSRPRRWPACWRE
jgi:DNA replication protein DnaC